MYRINCVSCKTYIIECLQHGLEKEGKSSLVHACWRLVSLLMSWLFHGSFFERRSTKPRCASGLQTTEALLAEECFFAIPFTSLLDLKLPVHPIPTNSNAFAAGSSPNSNCHAICLYSCAHQHLRHYFGYYCLCWTRKSTSVFSKHTPCRVCR